MPIQATTPSLPTWQAARPTWAPQAPTGPAPVAPTLGRDGLVLTQRQRPATGALPALPAPDLEAVAIPQAAAPHQGPAVAPAGPEPVQPAPAGPGAPLPAEPGAAAPDAAAPAATPEELEAHWAKVVDDTLREEIIVGGMRRFLQMEDRMRERAQEQK